jgi:GGDEF domain-containing protein
MDVNKAEAIAPALDAINRHAPEQRNDGAPGGGKHDEPAEHGWSDDDAVDVHGLPTDQLSPEAQRLIDALTQQIEPMRRDLEQAHAREAQLKQLATIDPVLELPNRRFGLAAADAAMRHAARLIGQAMHPTDTLGRVGAFDLGVVMLNGDGENVALRTEGVRRRFAAEPMTLPGGEAALAVLIGSAVLRPGQSADAAIDAADRALLALKQ